MESPFELAVDHLLPLLPIPTSNQPNRFEPSVHSTRYLLPATLTNHRKISPVGKVTVVYRPTTPVQSAKLN